MTVEITEFKSALKTELVKRGIPADTASLGIEGITKDITSEKRAMIERIKSADDLGRFAEALAMRIRSDAEKAKASQPKPTAQPQPKPAAKVAPKAEAQSKPVAKAAPKAEAQSKPQPTAQPKPLPQPQQKPQARTAYADVQPTAKFDKPRDSKLSSTAKFVPVHSTEPRQTKPAQVKKPSSVSDNMSKGDKIFLAVLIAGSPIWAFALGVFLIPSLICYLGIGIMIAVTVALLLAVTVFGASVSLFGIIYGIIKLFSVPQEGMYEIGLAAIIIGATLIVVILLYNLAVRYIPKLFVYAKQLLSIQTAKASDFYYLVRKECHRL